MLAEFPVETEERAIGFGLVAKLKTTGEPRQAEERKAPAEKKCKCGAMLDDKDAVARSVAGVHQETLFWCRRCSVYFNPDSGRRLGTRW